MEQRTTHVQRNEYQRECLHLHGTDASGMSRCRLLLERSELPERGSNESDGAEYDGAEYDGAEYDGDL